MKCRECRHWKFMPKQDYFGMGLHYCDILDPWGWEIRTRRAMCGNDKFKQKEKTE